MWQLSPNPGCTQPCCWSKLIGDPEKQLQCCPLGARAVPRPSWTRLRCGAGTAQCVIAVVGMGFGPGLLCRTWHSAVGVCLVASSVCLGHRAVAQHWMSAEGDGCGQRRPRLMESSGFPQQCWFSLYFPLVTPGHPCVWCCSWSQGASNRITGFGLCVQGAGH